MAEMEKNRYRLLIADDEVYVRDLLVKNVRDSDADVEVVAVAGDGKEALEAAKVWKPNIIITDIAMPFINGLELIKELQKIGISSKNIIISGYDEFEYAKQAISLGVTDYLLKPFLPRELIIKELQKIGISSKNIIISGYDEFEYAKQAISLGVTDYLLKPFLPRELIEVLKKSTEELDNQKILNQNMNLLKEQVKSHVSLAREHFLKEVLENGIKESSDTLEKAKELELNLKANYYIAGILRFQGGWEFETQEKVEEFLMLIGKGYFALGLNIYAVGIDKTQLAILICGETSDERGFCQLVQMGLEKISASMEKYYHTILFCGLGAVKKSISDLKYSYQEALCVWRSTLDIRKEKKVRFYKASSQILQEHVEHTNAANEIREWKNRIRLAVKAGHQDEALALLSGLMKSYVSIANHKTEYIGVSIGELIYALANDMEAEGYERERPEEIFEFEDKMKYGSLMDLKEILESYIKKCCQSIETDSGQTRANAMVKQVKFEFEDKMKYGSLMDLKEILESYIKKCCQSIETDSGQTRANAMVKQVKMLLETNLKNPKIDLEWAAQNVHFKKCCQSIETDSGQTRANAMVKQVKMLLETNLKNPKIDLEWAAQNVHFSASYVRQAFKQITGEGFGEYLIRKRMEKAGMLLQKTEMRIQDIAAECGYDNQRYFASSFKKFYGCTPTEFKKVVQEENLY